MKNFAVIGVAGYVAPRHLKAIKDTGNNLVAALDIHDSVGILDKFFPNTKFFTRGEEFKSYLEHLYDESKCSRVNFVSICTPNYLHKKHIYWSLNLKSHAICEKPLVIDPSDLSKLIDLELKSDKRIYTILQLRFHSKLKNLYQTFQDQPTTKSNVELVYITRRGPWYDVSWKGDAKKSGGLIMNIGIHLFDLLIWLFGKVEYSEVHLSNHNKVAGFFEMARARVKWYLSIDEKDLPVECKNSGQFALRSISIDGQRINFSDGFDELHTQVYEKILIGEGFGITDASPSIKLVHKIQQKELITKAENKHPILLEL